MTDLHLKTLQGLSKPPFPAFLNHCASLGGADRDKDKNRDRDSDRDRDEVAEEWVLRCTKELMPDP